MMRTIGKLNLMVHAFCWDCIAANPGGIDAKLLERYLAREAACARLWFERLERMGTDEVLATIPFGPSAAAEAFYARASTRLGDRFLLLDGPDPLQAGFWDSMPDNAASELAADLGQAFTGQGYAWNKEELHTALHSRAYVQRLQRFLQERDMTLAADCRGEAWGASFEGCVTKYSLFFRSLLGLPQPIEIPFDCTVPDAAFLLDIMEHSSCQVADGLRLFILGQPPHIRALYTCTTHTLADQPARVRLEVEPGQLAVASKQGLRLWPEPQPYRLENVPAGCEERDQQVVEYRDGRLSVPVSAGFVYRLAKAPAYITFTQPVTLRQALDILGNAQLAE